MGPQFMNNSTCIYMQRKMLTPSALTALINVAAGISVYIGISFCF